ncbi:NAD-glutamate dehydrogenase, partial [Priestia sp. SIMBA_032]|uniref:hypothetical protein n=1 Tax=Priestia sp. SIMBA_032 TaxID=3085775 RepID=UPI00397B0A70
VLDERPLGIERQDGRRCFVYEFGLSLADGMTVDEQNVADVEHRFTEAFSQIWRGDAAVDNFNELIFRCGLTWHEVAMLRAYASYLR